jgi:hypothetical protein
MPFYAIVEPLSGEVIEVTPSLDEPVPDGAIVVELPGRWEDLPAHLRAKLKNRGGGGGDEVFLDREEQDGQGSGRQQQSASDAEQFFARLEVELVRAEDSGRPLTVLLFELAAIDRPQGTDFVRETLEAHGQELLACDLVARLREHLVAVIMLDIEGHTLSIVPERGTLTVLTYPGDRSALDALRRRKHPLLRPPALRALRSR